MESQGYFEKGDISDISEQTAVSSFFLLCLWSCLISCYDQIAILNETRINTGKTKIAVLNIYGYYVCPYQKMLILLSADYLLCK